MATIKDVARMAGVSIATVSNYINQTKPVSKEASLKIQEAIDTLHYSLNLSAKSLKSSSYSDIGVILPNFDNSYYVQVFQGIESAFQNTGYYMNLSFSYDIPEFEQQIVNNLLKKHICGLILVSCQPDNWKFYHNRITSEKIQMVLIDRDIRNLDANFVSYDNSSLMKNLTHNLLVSGYKNIFLFSGPEEFDCEANCINGFFSAFQEMDLPVSNECHITTNLSKEDAFRKLLQLMLHSNPDVIVSTSEASASGISEGLMILGYGTERIPVYTLGEEHWNLYTHSFAYSSAVRPAIKIGKTAAEMLLEQLNSPLTKENERIILPNTTNFSHKTQGRSHMYIHEADRESPSKNLRILMMDTPQVHALLGLIKNFENRYKIRVDITMMPHHHLYNTIINNNSSDVPDDKYDVFMYDIPWLPDLASKKILEDITAKLKEIDLNTFLPNCLSYYSIFNNRYYGLPFMYAPQIFYYRKDLFEDPILKKQYNNYSNVMLRPPLTLKEFNTIADFFTNHTNAIDYGISIPAGYDEFLAPEIYMRLRAFGGKLFDSQGRVCLDSNFSLKAYINLYRSVRLAKPDYRTATDSSVVNDFLNGKTAMLISYPSFLTDITDLRTSSMIGSIGYNHIPSRKPLLGGWSLGISSKSTQKSNAFEFLKWTCNEQTANYFALLGGQSAITSSYTNDELIKLNPWFPLYHDAYKYTKPTIPPTHKNKVIISQNEIDSIVCKWLYDMFDDKIEVQDAIANTHSELEAIINKRSI